MAGRSGRDPTADGRKLEALREVSKCQAVGPQANLQGRAEHPSLDVRKSRMGIDIDQSVEVLEIDRDAQDRVLVVGSTPPTTLVPPPYGVIATDSRSQKLIKLESSSSFFGYAT